MPNTPQPLWRVASLTLLALIAFAANSVLCRVALGSGLIDAASFTVVRLVSGVVVLQLLVLTANDINQSQTERGGGWAAAAALFIYAIAFSYAYLTLETGTGALILFGAVQLTMITYSVVTGTRLQFLEIAGVAVAFGGLVWLNLPGVSAPSPLGLTLMLIAGIAWGAYTLLGRGSTSPLRDTCDNFLRTLPMALPLLVVIALDHHVTLNGILLAVASGGIASGIGYALWYAALRDITAVQAGVLQLSVPLIAAAGGIVLMAELLTLRLGLAALLILGGTAVVILAPWLRQRPGK